MIKHALLVVIACITALGCKSDEKPADPLKPAPKITALVPSKVTELGYRLGQIDGEGFDPKVPIKVYFGNTPAKRAAVVAKTKIHVEVPPGTANTSVEVRVEQQGYEPAIAPMKMEYEYNPHAHGSGAEAHDHADEAEPPTSPEPLAPETPAPVKDEPAKP